MSKFNVKLSACKRCDKHKGFDGSFIGCQRPDHTAMIRVENKNLTEECPGYFKLKKEVNNEV